MEIDSTFFISLQSVHYLSVIFSFPVGKEASSLDISLQKTKQRTQWYSESQITEVQLQELSEFVSTATWAGSSFLKTGSSINFSPSSKLSVFASTTLWSPGVAWDWLGGLSINAAVCSWTKDQKEVPRSQADPLLQSCLGQRQAAASLCIRDRTPLSRGMERCCSQPE